MSSYYGEIELRNIGFKSIGRDVLISRRASFYTPETTVIGDYSRIDDFCVITGNVNLGKYIHIAPFCLLAGGAEGIYMEDFSGLSSRVSIYAVSDDYSGESLTNPTVSGKYKNLVRGKVFIGRHVIIGTSSVILPGVTLGDGSAIGAMSLVTRDIDPWTINVGTPCRTVRERNKALLKKERAFILEMRENEE